ncbi:MAG: hypothetical protein CMH25_03320 [Micavibrio sp.]|nr:hypothetical protein [Micavibrio sp.]|tara:strand:+ start:650282 stop:651775 length:1494 start_codon:yes stop_codon:yes gene_type:complete
MLKSLNLFKDYVRQTAGATAVAFAIAIPIVVGSIGLATDFAFAYLVRQRLSHALDAAAVAAAAASNEGANLQAKIEEFLYRNYPESKIGTIHDLQITQNGSKINVSASSRFDTYFAKFLGVEEIDVYAGTEVTREIIGLEVALVLDVTGSMSVSPVDSNGTPAEKNNMEALRDASTSFTNILFDSAVFNDTVKIGLVPYSTSVNVGPYGLGQDLNGDYYDEPFVNNPSALSYYNPQAAAETPQTPPEEDDYSGANFQNWRGCVLARPNPDDEKDYEAGWMWDMYRFTHRYAANNFYRQWNSYYGTYNWVVYDYFYGPNRYCNKAHILPLTSNRDSILYEISKFQPEGSTSGNLGMTWGWRVISPEFPFQEGASYDDPTWKKAVVMMTDGDNTVNSVYGAYGGYTQNSVSVADMNNRFERTCTAMKEAGILIYTITFSYPTSYNDDGVPTSYNINDDTRGFYERCATEDKYYDALGQSELQDVFETISRELSNIHISG